MSIDQARAKVYSGKLLARGTEPYLTILWDRMRTVVTTDVPTMAVDKANRLYINPDFTSKLSSPVVSYVLLHETLHVALGHAKTFDEVGGEHATETQRFCWNVATDLYIQQLLARHHECNEPKGIIRLDGEVPKVGGKFLDVPGLEPSMSSKQYYALLLPLYEQQGDQQEDGDQGDSGESGDSQGQPSDSQPQALDPADAGSASDGQPKPWEVDSTGADEAMLDESLKEMAREIASGNHAGNIAGELRSSIEHRLVNKQVDPFKTLARIVRGESESSKGRKVYTYRRLSRRQQPNMPRRLGYKRLQPDVSIIIDMSGSMAGLGEKCLTAIAQGTKKLYRPRVVGFDTVVQSAKRITNAKQFNFQPLGGTAMDDAVVQEDKLRPNAIVVVTDGETNWPKQKTRAKLIIALVDKCRWETPSWATVIDCSEGEVN
jgi:predicted metal-dependent peptidase